MHSLWHVHACTAVSWFHLWMEWERMSPISTHARNRLSRVPPFVKTVPKWVPSSANVGAPTVAAAAWSSHKTEQDCARLRSWVTNQQLNVHRTSSNVRISLTCNNLVRWLRSNISITSLTLSFVHHQKSINYNHYHKYYLYINYIWANLMHAITTNHARSSLDVVAPLLGRTHCGLFQPPCF